MFTHTQTHTAQLHQASIKDIRTPLRQQMLPRDLQLSDLTRKTAGGREYQVCQKTPVDF